MNIYLPVDSVCGDKFDNAVIVVDEAHKVVAPTYQRVTRALLSDGAAVIGLTVAA